MEFPVRCFTCGKVIGDLHAQYKTLLAEKNMDNDDIWSSIATHEGSVQQLPFLTQEEKDVFKTAPEITQMWLVEHAADRARFICQAQSLNLFMPGDVSKKELHEVHFMAWKKGVKSLYYCRSTSMQRADKVSHDVPQAEQQLALPLEPSRKEKKASKKKEKQAANYEECLACQ